MRPRRQIAFFAATKIAAFGAVLGLASGVLGTGCKDPPPPAPPSGMPPGAVGGSETGAAPPPRHGLAPTDVPAPGAQAGDPHGGMLPPGHPQVNPGGGPAGEMPAVEDFDPKARLAGSIDLDPKLRASVTPGDVMFLVARIDDGSEKGGMILGVKRFEAKTFPLRFELDGRDAMAPGTKFAGKVMISARVDKDGDAMTKNPGDVLGVVHTQIPNEGLHLVLDTLTK